MRVPDDFLPGGTWVENFRDPAPNLSEGKMRLVNALRLVPSYNTKYQKLMSVESLIAAGLRPSLRSLPGDVARGEDEDVDDQGEMEPDMARVNDNDPLSSPTRGDELEEKDEVNDFVSEQDILPSSKFASSSRGEKNHPPVLGDVERMVEDIDWFVPPYPLESTHSYYNDVESIHKLSANIVTPVDAKFIRNMRLDAWRSRVSECGTKVLSFLLTLYM